MGAKKTGSSQWNRQGRRHHAEPGDPFRLDNVVEQLDHGTVVTAVEESNGWVRHDLGGWSIKTHGGHAFLVPLDDVR